jgi:hypothetical protein
LRREAGFSEEELDDLARISREGPSRKTLLEAARIIRDRHRARRAQEPAA